jgi:hypothetical protein
MDHYKPRFPFFHIINQIMLYLSLPAGTPGNECKFRRFQMQGYSSFLIKELKTDGEEPANTQSLGPVLCGG